MVGGADGKVTIVALNSDGTVQRAESSIPNGNAVTGIVYSPNGERTIAVGETSDHRTFLRYWSTAARLKSDTHFTKPIDFKITSECFDASNRKIYLGCEDGGIYLWDSEEQWATIKNIWGVSLVTKSFAVDIATLIF